MTGSLSAVLVDPVLVTWKALGAPASVATSGPVARCGRCSQEQSLKLLREVLSLNFTGWHQVDPSSHGLCEPCAWSFQNSKVRTLPILVSTDTAVWVTLPELSEILCRPLPMTFALSLPRRGQKHLLPGLQWGGVSTDSGTVFWGEDASELLNTAMLARDAGASKSGLRAAAPSIEVIRNAGERAFLWWDIFARWKGTTHFEIAHQVVVGSASQ